MKKHIYNLEFTEEELQMIYLVFSRLETKCLQNGGLCGQMTANGQAQTVRSNG